MDNFDFDEALRAIYAECRKEKDSNVWILNAKRLEEAKASIDKIMLCLPNPERVKKTARMDRLIGTTLMFECNAESIICDEQKYVDALREAVSLCDTFEVYPLTDGTIDIGLSFENVKVKAIVE